MRDLDQSISIRRPGEDTARILPRSISIRRGAAQDELAAFDVMRRAMGYEMSWQHHSETRQHLLTTPGSSFWVAEESSRFGSSRIVGYARSLVREQVWALTEFFVLPSSHRKGIGSALLRHCLEDGAELGADTQLVLASNHPSADGLYIRRAGCFPRMPMLLLSGPLSWLQTPEDLGFEISHTPA
ncbi:MAG TPA: GNAT family N-acetyltransferase, partial [Chthonomonadales bacterium]|nr:GNAT family N-acetyltransferase [Chthonomonadales bacterium]